MRTLRVLSEHPGIGRPNDLLPEFDGAQAYVDAGLAEWVQPVGGASVADVDLETTEDAALIETTTRRPATRSRTADAARGAAAAKSPRAAQQRRTP